MRPTWLSNKNKRVNSKATTKPRCSSNRTSPFMLTICVNKSRTILRCAISRVKARLQPASPSLCQGLSSMKMLADFFLLLVARTTLLIWPAMVMSSAWVVAINAYQVTEVPEPPRSLKFWSHWEISALLWSLAEKATLWWWQIKVICIPGVEVMKGSLACQRQLRLPPHPNLSNFSIKECLTRWKAAEWITSSTFLTSQQDLSTL